MQVIDAELGGARAAGIGAYRGIAQALAPEFAGGRSQPGGAGSRSIRQVSAGSRAADLKPVSRTAVTL